ncbi:hypothetical protein D9M73_197140 [compost metagenome]
MALQHLRQLEHRAAELFEGVAGLVVQAQLDEHQEARAQHLRVEPRVVAEDHPVALQAADPLGARGGRQVDPLAQFGEGNPPLLLEDAQDAAVGAIQVAPGLLAFVHGGCHSVKWDFAENYRHK